MDTIHAFYRYVLVKAWVPEVQEPQVCARPGKHKSQKPRKSKFVRDQETEKLRNPGSPSLCETQKTQKSTKTEIARDQGTTNSEIQEIRDCARPRNANLRNPGNPSLCETRKAQNSEIQENRDCASAGNANLRNPGIPSLCESRKRKTQKPRKPEFVRDQGRRKLRNPGNPGIISNVSLHFLFSIVEIPGVL